MSVRFARPDVSTLMLRLFPRPLHPELFDVPAGLVIQSGDIRIDVQLCPSGHIWTWQCRRRFITEALAEKDRLLPHQSCILDHKVRGCRMRSLAFSPTLRYDVGCQVETLEPDLFLQIDDELRDDCSKADLSHEFPAESRFAPGAISLIRLELTRTSTMIHAYHTFPDHCAIVKTQSLIEWEA